MSVWEIKSSSVVGLYFSTLSFIQKTAEGTKGCFPGQSASLDQLQKSRFGRRTYKVRLSIHTSQIQGQGRVEQYCQIILTISGVISFIAGFFMKSVEVTVIFLCAGTLLTALVCVPPWPMYHTNPIKYLPQIDSVTVPKQSAMSWLF